MKNTGRPSEDIFDQAFQRLGKRAAIINPQEYSMSDGVAIMTGAKEV